MTLAARPAPSEHPGRRSLASVHPTASAALVVGVLCAATFAAYLATLSSGVLGGDAGELQFVPPILGLPHPTGYPLQVLVHKLWSLLPHGSVAYRLNVLDAGFAALAVGLVAAVGHAMTGRWGPAVVGALALAFGELWWSQAVRGDKYTLNGLFLTLVLLLYLRWRAEPRTGRLAVLALAYGLSLAHHRSMLLVAPALATGVVLSGWRPRGWREPLGLAALVLAPLGLYAYVPWAGSRGLPPGSWPVDTPAAFVEFLLDRGYTSQIRPDAALAGRLAEEARVLARSFGPLGVLLGVVGLAWSFRRDWRSALVLAAVFVPQAVLGASYLLESSYQLPRHWVFYLPGFVVWAVWAGLGAHAALLLFERLPTGHRLIAGRRRAALLASLALVGLALQAGTVWARAAEPLVRAEAGAETLDTWRQDLQRSPLADRFARLALSLAEPNAVIVCDWEQATALWYQQQVDGRRPDVVIRYPIERLDEELAAARGAGRAVYVSRTLPGLEGRGVTSSRGPLVQVWPPPATSPPPGAMLFDARFDGGLALAGVEYHAGAFWTGGVVPFTLYWRADRPMSDDLAVSVRLLDAAGATLASHDERHPALGTSPTSRWQPGQVVGDYRELPLGTRLPAGQYRIAVVPYRVEPREELRPLGRDEHPTAPPLLLEPLSVERRPSLLFDLVTRLRGR